MAKFGIALGSGPRGLGFESRYSDQIRKLTQRVGFLIWMYKGIRKDGTSAHTGVKSVRWTLFSPWEDPLVSGRTPCGCGQKSNLFAFETPSLLSNRIKEAHAKGGLFSVELKDSGCAS